MWGIIVALILIFIVIPYVGMAFVMPPIVFNLVLKRRHEDNWSRNHPSDLKNEEMLAMWDQALSFRKQNEQYESEIETTTSDGLHLKGLYYDFGSKTAVIIVPGRPESCIYSLHYAYPYKDKGINVCVIDTRAHGLSEGEYSGCAYAEKKDILAFAKTLHEKGIEKIILHGICVGSGAIAFVLGSPHPSYIKGAVTDGLFHDFYSTMKRRIRRNHGIVYPTIFLFRHKIKKLYGVDIKKEGAFTLAQNFDVPFLMLASKKDIFSIPKETAFLFALNGSKEKEMVWFEEGAHSHLRITDHLRYDEAVYRLIDKVESL